MKISINDVEKINARAKCYYDEENGNPYCSLNVEIFVKEEKCPNNPSYGVARTKFCLTTKAIWGHYGKSSTKEVVSNFLTRSFGFNHGEMIKKSWWKDLEVTCSYYKDIDKLVW